MKVREAIALMKEYGAKTTLEEVARKVQGNKIHKCPKCGGTGTVTKKKNEEQYWECCYDWEYYETTCDLCNGEGYTEHEYKPKMIQDGWIPAEDGLPKANERVLVTAKHYSNVTFLEYQQKKLEMLYDLGRKEGVCKGVICGECPLHAGNNDTSRGCIELEFLYPEQALKIVMEYEAKVLHGNLSRNRTSQRK